MANSSSSSSELIVQTGNGPVQGTSKTSLYGVAYVSFQGIPYAKPPVGELRFKDPVPPTNWTDVLDCTKQCDPCYHFDRRVNQIVGSEDSLRLNIFTKTIKPTAAGLPVMVYLYGGGFVEGTSATELYGPDYLIEKDIVLVTLNYRVGALGFLCCQSPDAGVPGNAGLKDQRMALRWVRDNVARFGGDPTSITLFGHSAGGASVQYHLLSNQSSGLFDRAIIMSGSTMCDWALSPQRNWVEKLAKAIGWQGECEGEQAALEFLRQAAPEDIVAHQEKLFGPQEIQEGLLTPFGPTIEPYQSEVCFIPKAPREMLQAAWGNSINVMIGGTSEEGLILLQKVKPNLAAVLQDPRLFAGNVPMHLPLAIEQRMAFAAQLKQLYYPDSEPGVDNLGGFIDMASDRVFWHGLHRTILARASQQAQGIKTFVYRFAVDSPFFNHYRIHMVDPDIRGTSHADEISYLFSNIFATALDQNTMEYRAIREIVDIFTSFAANGDPNCSSTSKVTWNAVPDTVPPYECLNIGNDGITVQELPEGKRMKVWDSFYANDALF
ncbi:esterase B1 [Anopheles darlingi]|uniref:Carboxylic ester hydrolase n=1 Tax=Anopheles darlingi TaxID=43151 RepID=W5JB39_ANODA|nr:esterase B1 [Anopheles darlingi]